MITTAATTLVTSYADKPAKSFYPGTIAVLIPCYNEAASIGKVVTDFRHVLPDAVIYVYDNNSTDGTAAIARRAGAEIRHESMQGKGNVVRRMFYDIEADFYILVDGDDTYDSASAPALLDLLLARHADMVTGTRVTDIQAAYRRGHRVGNVVLTGIVSLIFGDRITDMLSGYRVFSRRFVKTFPALSSGFETETELSIHALELKMPLAEMDVSYRDRPAGSISKLSTYRDGLRIVFTIVTLIKEERPLQFFLLLSFLLLALALFLGMPVLVEYQHTRLVPRLPTAVLCASIVMLSFLAFVCGLIMDSISRARKEIKYLAYLSVPLQTSLPPR